MAMMNLIGNVQVDRIASLSNALKLCSDHFPGWLFQLGDLNKGDS
jgi:hypothetical protein